MPHDQDQEMQESPKRILVAPSASTTVGTLGGAGLGPIIVWALGAFTSVTVPPEIAASIGAIVANVIGYFFDGGRKA